MGCVVIWTEVEGGKRSELGMTIRLELNFRKEGRTRIIKEMTDLPDSLCIYTQRRVLRQRTESKNAIGENRPPLSSNPPPLFRSPLYYAH